MTTLLLGAPFPLMAAAHSTLALIQAPTFLSTAEAVSTIVLTLAVLGVLFALILVLLQLRRITGSAGNLAKRLEKDATPVLDRARIVAENMEFITAAVREDVQKLNESVMRLNDRLKQASDRMEERIQDFTALVEVLQEEAEDLALDTAAAVRGVRVGTQSLAGARKSFPSEPEVPDALPTAAESDGGEG